MREPEANPILAVVGGCAIGQVQEVRGRLGNSSHKVPLFPWGIQVKIEVLSHKKG